MDLGCVTEGGIGAALGAEVIYNLGADEVEIPAGRVRDLPGQPRRPRRAPGGRDPAGGGLDRGAGDFRQYRGAAADGEPRRLPAGRGAGELGDPRALSAALGRQLAFDSLAALRARMVAAAPHLGVLDVVPENAWTLVEAGDMSGAAFRSPVRQHYLANPIMRASGVMAELTRLADARERPMAAE